MKGRKVSNETATMVRELRRRGLSLRKIAQRAKLSKTTVYRLTQGISWEETPVRLTDLEIRQQVQPRDAENGQVVRSTAPLECQFLRQVPEEEAPNKEKSELDEAEAYLMQDRISSVIYKIIDAENRLQSLDSEEPLEEYNRLRKRVLSEIALLLGIGRA